MEQSAFDQRVITEFREQRGTGKVADAMDAAVLLLLTHIGARSGEPRTTPLGFLRLGERLCVIASANGAARHPAWFHNLVANPAVEVELGAERFRATAVVPSGRERDELFAEAARIRPFLTEHQSRTQRLIPVVELRREGEH
ncbi:nitroreductase/quinone reductase family protein [Streptomyces avicenniae]|uniref:nitroreductase/quinone reductase family protein n=1 Tax=Streptomyces avicenniae TaxID=500153 RepID=UPI00069C3240|nr:nitroreductase/quinone reductase family protein [Streptomyces avicenniae]